MKMRIPTDEEYNKLADATDGDDAKIHWKDMLSHVNDANNQYGIPAFYSVRRGFSSARYWVNDSASYRGVHLGFRPAFDNLATDFLSSDIKVGDPIVIGTLYMGGKPVKVPQNPTRDGNIEDYILGAKLEMGPALDDVAYQVTGIYIGDGVVVADRALLKMISYKDLEMNIANSKRHARPVSMELFRQLLFDLAMDMGGGSADYDGPNLEFINRLLDLVDAPVLPDASISTEAGDIQAVPTGDNGIAVNRRVNLSTSLEKDVYDTDTLLNIRYLGHGQVEVKTANGSTILLD